jgi:glutamate synthase (NADPH/NADH) large chain
MASTDAARRRLRGRHQGPQSHTIVQQAIQVLKNLAHRGTCGCEINTGDGADGILIQMPDAFLRKVRGAAAPPATTAVGSSSPPQEAASRGL